MKVFKEHFNIIHGRMEHNHAGLTRAEENHFKVRRGQRQLVARDEGCVWGPKGAAVVVGLGQAPP